MSFDISHLNDRSTDNDIIVGIIRGLKYGLVSRTKLLEILKIVTNLLEIHNVTIPDSFQFDMTKNGWTLETPSTSTVPLIALQNLELVPFLGEGEENTNGYELRHRATAKKASLGQRHGEDLLKRSELLKGFEEYILVFPDDVWLSETGCHIMFCLTYSGGKHKWTEGWVWQDNRFFDNRYRLLRPANQNI